MRRDLLNNSALILYLIRQGATTWATLCSQFDMDPLTPHTGATLLRRALRNLEHANLINITPPLERDTLLKRASFSNVIFTVAPLLDHIQAVLDISVAELAHSDPRYRVIVSPQFRTHRSEKYGRDIFVLMPFTMSLSAVYEDHLKAVAREFGMTIARADDFFTTHEVMTEIWSAIVASKLLIADCTGRNPNVFYEVGLAHAVGKPVILITQQTDDVPFDLRHLRYITYELTPPGVKALEQNLTRTIKEVWEEITLTDKVRTIRR